MLRVLLPLALLVCAIGCTPDSRSNETPSPPPPIETPSPPPGIETPSPPPGSTEESISLRQGTVDDSRPAPRPGKGKRIALLVGVRDYDGKGLSDLKYTENDVEELAAVLKKSGFAEVVVLTSTRGEKEAKFAPTRANIERELKRVLKMITKHDLLVIGLAGHGVQYRVRLDDKDGDESFFCPADARLATRNDEEERATLFKKLAATMLPFRELFKQFDGSEAGTRLLLIDACRNDVSSRNADTDAMPRVTKGTAALFACKGGERAFESDKLGKGHGVFFHHVIAALKGAAVNKRGEVTWNALTRHVYDEVPDAVERLVGGGARQTPHQITNVEGDPVLVPKTGPPPEKDKDKDKGKVKPDAKLWKVKAPIGVGIMKDDKGEPSDSYFDKGDLVRIIAKSDKAVKIEKGRRSGWLSNEQALEYLEEEK